MLRNIPKRGAREARVAQPRSEATKAKRFYPCWVIVRNYYPNISALEKTFTLQDSFMFLSMVISNGSKIWNIIFTFFTVEKIKTNWKEHSPIY